MTPARPISPSDPACVIFHAQEILRPEGRTADNTIQLFRPDCNGQRMQDLTGCISQDPCGGLRPGRRFWWKWTRHWVPHSTAPPVYPSTYSPPMWAWAST